jgi:hypothetical protein
MPTLIIIKKISEILIMLTCMITRLSTLNQDKPENSSIWFKEELNKIQSLHMIKQQRPSILQKILNIQTTITDRVDYNLFHKRYQQVQSLTLTMSGTERMMHQLESHILLQKVPSQPHGPKLTQTLCKMMEVKTLPKQNLKV